MPIFKTLTKTLIRKSTKPNRTFVTTSIYTPSPLPPILSCRSRLSTFHKWVLPFSGPLFLSSTPWKLSQFATPLYIQCDVVALRTKAKALNLLETTAWCLPATFRIPQSVPAGEVGLGRVRVVESKEDEHGVGSGGMFVESFVNLPNIISMSRLISGPVLGWYVTFFSG